MNEFKIGDTYLFYSQHHEILIKRFVDNETMSSIIRHNIEALNIKSPRMILTEKTRIEWKT